MDQLTYDLYRQLSALVVQIKHSGRLIVPSNVAEVLVRAEAQLKAKA